MYVGITKLSAPSRTFVLEMNNNALSRTQEAYIALAKVLSNSLALPLQEVNDFINYFNVTYKPNLRVKLGEINELTLIDIETVEEYTRMFLYARYLALFPEKRIYCFWRENAAIQFFGLSKAIPESIIDLINKDYTNIVRYVDGYTGVLADLTDTAGE